MACETCPKCWLQAASADIFAISSKNIARLGEVGNEIHAGSGDAWPQGGECSLVNDHHDGYFPVAKVLPCNHECRGNVSLAGTKRHDPPRMAVGSVEQPVRPEAHRTLILRIGAMTRYIDLC
jgi:hypothetical protein